MITWLRTRAWRMPERDDCRAFMCSQLRRCPDLSARCGSLIFGGCIHCLLPSCEIGPRWLNACACFRHTESIFRSHLRASSCASACRSIFHHLQARRNSALKTTRVGLGRVVGLSLTAQVYLRVGIAPTTQRFREAGARCAAGGRHACAWPDRDPNLRQNRLFPLCRYRSGASLGRGRLK